MIRRRFLSAAIAAAVAVSGFVGTTFTGDSLAKAAEANWKMHVVWVESRPEAQAFHRFAKLADKRAGDKLDIRFFSGGALGIQDVDMLRILPQGTAIQLAGLYPGYMTRDEPEYAYVIPPGVVSEAKTLVEILPTLAQIYQDTYSDWGIKLLGFVMHPSQKTHIICKEPVRTLEELKSKKVRVWESFHVELFGRLGIAAQVIPQNELYVAMQTGVVDCAVYPVLFGLTLSLQEVAPYASYLFPYVLHPLNIIASEKALDSLPKDVQETLEKTAKQVQRETVETYLSGTLGAKAREEWKSRGGKILKPFSTEDRELFTQTARKLWKELSHEAGDEATANYELVSEAIDKATK